MYNACRFVQRMQSCLPPQHVGLARTARYSRRHAPTRVAIPKSALESLKNYLYAGKRYLDKDKTLSIAARPLPHSQSPRASAGLFRSQPSPTTHTRTLSLTLTPKLGNLRFRHGILSWERRDHHKTMLGRTSILQEAFCSISWVRTVWTRVWRRHSACQLHNTSAQVGSPWQRGVDDPRQVQGESWTKSANAAGKQESKPDRGVLGMKPYLQGRRGGSEDRPAAVM